MRLPYPLLTLPAAAACWIIAGLCHEAPRDSQGFVEPHNPLAVQRSAYGSLLARLMKDSLHSYWHAGCTDPNHGHPVPTSGKSESKTQTPTLAAHPSNCTDPKCGHPVSSPPNSQLASTQPGAGRFARRTSAPAPPLPPPSSSVPAPALAPALPSPAPEAPSWLELASKNISRLEHMRQVRNSPFAVAPAHKRFLSASADWRVHLAWQLDPGDAALYEIDHFTAVSRAGSPEKARKVADDLAARTIQHALSPQASLADALTGAGAAINVLNDKMRPGTPYAPQTTELLRDWRVLTFCLNRHRDLRQQADEEDWWSEIPEVRRTELETYATMLTRLSSMIQQKLAANGTLPGQPTR